MLQIFHLNGEIFTGDWHYCEVPNVHESAIVDIDSTCFDEKISQNSESSWIPEEGEYDLEILTRDPNEITGIGKECQKIKRSLTTYVNIFGAQSKTSIKEHITLTARECTLMATTEMCEQNLMTCDEKKSCYFKGEFQEKYIYLSYNTEIIFDCMVKNKLIIANNMETKLFGQNCLINELKCQLKKSIVVWNSEIYTHCPFKKLAVDSMKYNFNENIFYTEDNSRMFMIKNKTEHCGIKMYETAEGAILVDKNETTDLK